MTTQARELAKIVNNAGDLFFVDDVALASDGAVLNFGADNDVTLTHVADTALLLNSTRQLQFGDSGTYIHQSADGVLDLVSDTEIELNATTLDINANVDISGTLTVAGALDFGDLDISNVGSIALDTITNDGTDITLDSSGDIILDAGGADIKFKDDGTSVLEIKHESASVDFLLNTTNDDFKFKGNDDGSTITALTLDMSDAGAATFNGKITADAGIDIDNFNIDGTTIALSSGDITIDVAGGINLDSDGGEISFKDAGTEIGKFNNSSSDFSMEAGVQDKDILFRGNDGGSGITALTLDMSDAGAATFNGSVTLATLLDLNVNSSTAYSSTGEPREDIIIHNTNGADGSGVNNHSTLGFHVADGATSQGFINYVRTADNTGAFTFSQRTGSSSYEEAMRLSNLGNLHLSGGSDRRIQLGSGGAGANQVSNNTVHIRGDAANMKFMAASGGMYQYEINGTEVARIDSNGDFAIRTTDTTSALTVSQVDNDNPVARFDIACGALNAIVGMQLRVTAGAANAANKFFIQGLDDTSTERFRFNTNGSGSMSGSLTQNSSDERLKEEITTIENPLEKLKTLRGVNFTWKDKTPVGNLDLPEPNTKDVGVIAQEVQSVLPEAVELAPLDTEYDENGNKVSKTGENYLAVFEKKIIPLLIESIKEQQTIIEDLKSRIETLEG